MRFFPRYNIQEKSIKNFLKNDLSRNVLLQRNVRKNRYTQVYIYRVKEVCLRRIYE
jgi:hypothetical protein